MQKYDGVISNKGIVLGEIYHFKKADITITKQTVANIEDELKRFEIAKLKSLDQLNKLFDKVMADLGEDKANIIDVQRMFLDDLDYNEFIEDKIKDEMINADYAINEAKTYFSNLFESMDDEYMKGRAFDIRDISNRLIENLLGISSSDDITKPVIIVAEDLSPSETVKFDKSKILGFVTKKGTLNSHTDILAKTMNIPALINVNLDLSNDLSGMEIAIDALAAIAYIEPTEEVKRELDRKKIIFLEEKEKMKVLIGKEDITKCGKHIKLFSNIGSVADVESVLKHDSQGIGLFRSEFLYLGRDTLPSEEEQFTAYKAVAEKMGDKKVIIRTLDIGADKEAKYLNIPKEENPALGYRAIRICLDQTNIFKEQLRALYRASAFGNISIMLPMIISVDEVLESKKIIEEIKAELKSECHAFKDVELGIMIETPASVIISDDLAKVVDFFSVGTNDLTQYTLAVDRQNQNLSHLFSSKNIAILKMLEIVVENAHKNGIWAGICGAIASDAEMTEKFLQMGYDELSVTPSKTLEVRNNIRNTTL
ncbi:MAG: phosphoenolpyruvate--protein phosphotransferase [Lachnospirales bacterium]